MPPQARKTNRPTSTNMNKAIVRKASLRQVQQEDQPSAADDVQGGAQGAGPSRENGNRHRTSALQVTDDRSWADIQAMMVKVAKLENQNRQLLSSMSTSQTFYFILHC